MAALVEDHPPGGDALFECPHQLGAVVRESLPGVEHHLPRMGPVLVPQEYSGRVELGVAVVALVASELSQGTAGYVFAVA